MWDRESIRVIKCVFCVCVLGGDQSPDIAILLFEVDTEMARYARRTAPFLQNWRWLRKAAEGQLFFYDQTLTDLGFARNDWASCFQPQQGWLKISVAGSVDDLLFMNSEKSSINNLLTALIVKFEELKTARGHLHNYLGMVHDLSSAPLCTPSDDHTSRSTVSREHLK